MKGSIASLLMALEALQATRTVPRMNVEVSFTADEETDSALGTGWLVEHAPIKPDYAVVMEGGEGSAVCCGHNGVVWLEVTVHGRPAHGSTPERGSKKWRRSSLASTHTKKNSRAVNSKLPKAVRWCRP
jgi:succinyl-diaminopimelate desuccinylase